MGKRSTFAVLLLPQIEAANVQGETGRPFHHRLALMPIVK